VKYFPLLFLGVLACTSTRSEPAPKKVAQAPVVVTIVVDQFAAWVASERLETLPPDGGFARLRREGTYVRAIRYAHAATETACGHAALFTGAPPVRSGVMSNEALRHGRVVSTMMDDDTRLVAPRGVSARAGASPKVLRVDGLADVFRARYPDALVLGLSLKDRGAILPAGKSPKVAVWFDIETAELVTSTYYGEALPAWAVDVSRTIPERLAQPWTPLDPAWLAKHVLTPDDQDGEEPGMRAFPHDLIRQAPLGAAVRLSPQSDIMLVELALAALDAERRDGQPTLLSLSLSANDIIGHAFGPDAWEAWDELLRLDGTLAHLFDGLDKRFGPDGWAVALSADHGVEPIPEVQPKRPECQSASEDRWGRPCRDLKRMSREVITQELIKTAENVLGPGQWLHGFVGAFVALTPEGRGARERLVPFLLATLKAQPGVAGAFDVKALPATCPTGPGLDALVCNAYPADSEGDIMVVLSPGAGFGDGSGATHGMPYTYDLTVPFLVRAPEAVTAGRVIDEDLPFSTFTHTVAKLLNVAPPPTAFPAKALD
jgi:hypothetical protein